MDRIEQKYDFINYCHNQIVKDNKDIKNNFYLCSVKW